MIFRSCRAAFRGKYYRRATAGTNLALINPDLANMFPDSEAVNRALRVLAEAAQNGSRLQTRTRAFRTGECCHPGRHKPVPLGRLAFPAPAPQIISFNNSGRGWGITTLFTSMPFSPTTRAPASTALLHGGDVARQGDEGFASQRHGQADLDQLDVGGLDGRVGAFDQSGHRERFHDAERFQRPPPCSIR